METVEKGPFRRSGRKFLYTGPVCNLGMNSAVLWTTQSYPHRIHSRPQVVHSLSPKGSSALGIRFSLESVTRPVTGPFVHRSFPQASTGCARIGAGFHMRRTALAGTRHFCLCTREGLWIIPVDNLPADGSPSVYPRVHIWNVENRRRFPIQLEYAVRGLQPRIDLIRFVSSVTWL